MRRAQGDSIEAENLLREALLLRPSLRNKNIALIEQPQSTLALTLADQRKIDEAEATARDNSRSAAKRQKRKTHLRPFLNSSRKLSDGKEKVCWSRIRFIRSWKNLPKNSDSATFMAGRQSPNSGLFSLSAGQIYRSPSENIRNFENLQRKSSKSQFINYPTALTIQGLILNKTNRTDKAEKVLREAVKIRLENLTRKHFLTAFSISALGECLTTQKRFDEAEPLLKESFKNLKISQSENSPRTLQAQARLNKLYQDWKK